MVHPLGSEYHLTFIMRAVQFPELSVPSNFWHIEAGTETS